MTTALDFYCTTCGSPRGHSCRVRGVITTTPHKSREEKAITARAKIEHTGKLTWLNPKRVVWTRYDRCEECGAEPSERCCDMDNEPLEAPCPGRPLKVANLADERARRRAR